IVLILIMWIGFGCIIILWIFTGQDHAAVVEIQGHMALQMNGSGKISAGGEKHRAPTGIMCCFNSPVNSRRIVGMPITFRSIIADVEVRLCMSITQYRVSEKESGE